MIINMTSNSSNNFEHKGQTCKNELIAAADVQAGKVAAFL